MLRSSYKNDLDREPAGNCEIRIKILILCTVLVLSMPPVRYNLFRLYLRLEFPGISSESRIFPAMRIRVMLVLDRSPT